MENQYYPYINLPLPYEFDALEPFIDKKTMMLHHNKHLQAYIQQLNDIMEYYPDLQKLTLKQLICMAPCLSGSLGRQIRNNAGGVYNHRFYFELLMPADDAGVVDGSIIKIGGCERKPSGRLLQAINRDFGDYASFKSEFKKAAMSVFGSGYTWLVSQCKNLKIVNTANQDNPMVDGLKPLLVIDVWEHAYYLKHYNLRADYIDDWFSVINWDKVSQNYMSFN